MESRVVQYKEALPWCEEIVRLGIRNEDLLTYHIAVCEKAEMLNISRESAAYRVIEDIRDYDKLDGLKNEISKMVMQQYTIGQIMAPREKAIADDEAAGIRGDRQGNIQYLRMAEQDTRKNHYQQIAKML